VASTQSPRHADGTRCPTQLLRCVRCAAGREGAQSTHQAQEHAVSYNAKSHSEFQHQHSGVTTVIQVQLCESNINTSTELSVMRNTRPCRRQGPLSMLCCTYAAACPRLLLRACNG
jgi:hypothetical protein